MIAVFLGLIGSAVTLYGIHLAELPQTKPLDEWVLPTTHAVGQAMGETVRLRPLSELKFQNITQQVYDYSCGSAALVTILKSHFGLALTEQQAMEGMLAHGEFEKIIARRSFSLLDMKRFVSTLGLEANGFRGELHDLRKLTEPVIVPVDFENFKHFVVLRGIRDGRVYLADPALGHLVLSESEFMKIWDRNTLFQIKANKAIKPLQLLALSNQELGLFDEDLIRADAVLRFNQDNNALQEAVKAQQGIATWR